MVQQHPESQPDPAEPGSPSSDPNQPAPGELPYDAYPAPSGGVFEQASHEPIAPIPGAPDYQTPPPGPVGSGPAGPAPYSQSPDHQQASSPAGYQLPPDLAGLSDPASHGAEPQPYDAQSYDTQPYDTQQYGTQPYGTQPYGTQPYGGEAPAQDAEAFAAATPAYGLDPQYGVDQYSPDQFVTDQYGNSEYGSDQYGSDQYGADPQSYGVEVDGFGWGAQQAAQAAAPPPQSAAPSGPSGVRPPGEGLSRYAQLSYTSYDRPGQQGGWSVKETLGDLDENEIARLRDAVQTQFDSGVELPKFPTAADLAAFPRRLLFAPLGETAAALWHTAPAGSDASGRPGNVFAHVLMDRDRRAGGDDHIGRPIQLWRSSGWRTPYGADEVRETDLPEQLPQPTHGLTTQPVVDFLTDPEHWRLPTFTVLLDACAAAMDGGQPIVLLVESVDRAAQWLAALSRVMTPVQSRELFFSTLERPTGLASAFGRGVKIACVPATDQEAVTRDRATWGCVVMSETEVVELGDTGGTHRTASGDAIAVTPWCGLVTGVFADPARAVETLRAADRLASTATDAAADPLWSLALAVTEEGNSDVLNEAAAILATGAPASLLDDPGTKERVSAIIQGHLGSTTADAWQACDGRNRPIVNQLYLHRAVADVEWLTRAEGVPVPDGAEADPALLDKARTMARDLHDMAEFDPRTVSVAALRMSGLLDQIGAEDQETAQALQTLTDQVILRQLGADPAGMAEAVGPLRPTTRRMVVASLQRDPTWTQHDPGHRLPPDFLAWLLSAGPAELPADAELTGERRLRGELAINRWRAGDESELPMAGWIALAEGATGLQAELFEQVVWPVEPLSTLQGMFESSMPPNAWLATLKATEEMTSLFGQVCTWFAHSWQPGQAGGPPQAALAALRILPQGWSRLDHRATMVHAAIHGAAVAQHFVPMVPFASDAARNVQLAVVLAAVDATLVADPDTEFRLEGLKGLFAGQRLVVDADFVADVATHLAQLELSEVAGRIAAADPRFGIELTGGAARVQWLDQMIGPEGKPVLAEALHRALGEHPDRKELAGWIREGVDRPGQDTKAVDSLIGDWVNELIGAEERRRGLFRGGQ